MIGAGTLIDKTASLTGWIDIGNRCHISAGARIGDVGFGYQRDRENWLLRDHPYGVVIGNNVDIGPNTVIHRGRWRHTVIGTSTKIDAGVFVAHNVQIGERCLLVAHAKFGGSVTVGNDAIIGLGATICPHLTIGDDAIIGAGAVVTKDVPAGEVWAGNPARKFRDRREDETL